MADLDNKLKLFWQEEVAVPIEHVCSALKIRRKDRRYLLGGIECTL